jgi:hypothetical protein
MDGGRLQGAEMAARERAYDGRKGQHRGESGAGLAARKRADCGSGGGQQRAGARERRVGDGRTVHQKL